MPITREQGSTVPPVKPPQKEGDRKYEGSTLFVYRDGQWVPDSGGAIPAPAAPTRFGFTGGEQLLPPKPIIPVGGGVSGINPPPGYGFLGAGGGNSSGGFPFPSSFAYSYAGQAQGSNIPAAPGHSSDAVFIDGRWQIIQTPPPLPPPPDGGGGGYDYYGGGGYGGGGYSSAVATLGLMNWRIGL
jgi:hypothetical protein